MPTSAFMLQHNWQAHYDETLLPARQTWVDIEAIPPSVLLAVIAAEDQLFPQHYGIDTQATRHAIQAALNGEQSGGGSTLTQQVAKNLFLWGGRSYVRKGLEWVLALLLEALWSKQRILEVYLNIAQFSERDYGVGAASEHLFNKKVQDLARAEAALLAAVLPAPARYQADQPSAYVRKRQRFILKQMRQLGGIRYLEALD